VFEETFNRAKLNPRGAVVNKYVDML